MAQTPTVLTIELTDALIPGRELQLAGPESITHVPAKAGNRFRIMDSGLAARSQVYAGCVKHAAAPRNDSLRRVYQETV